MREFYFLKCFLCDATKLYIEFRIWSWIIDRRKWALKTIPFYINNLLTFRDSFYANIFKLTELSNETTYIYKSLSIIDSHDFIQK